MSKLETNTIDTVSGTSTLQVGSTNTSTITLGVSGDTINVPSGVTIANSGTATGFGANTPAFLAYLTGDQSISDSSFTKIPNDTERYDTDNAYDNSTNYRFTVPSGKAGKYYLYAAQVYSGTQELYRTTISLYINGSRVHSVHGHNPYSNSAYGDGAFMGVVYDLSVGDYAEIYTFVDTSNGTTAVLTRSDTGLTNPVYFGGFKIIE